MNSAQEPGTDPGWQLHTAAPTLIPLLGSIWRVRHLRDRSTDRVLVLRGLYLNFVLAVCYVFVVVGILAHHRFGRLGGAAGWLAVVSAVWGAATVVIVAFLRKRPLRTTTPGAVAASYRSNLFLKIAFAEWSALLAFAFFIVASRWWLYAIGWPFSLAGFVVAAPGRGDIQHRQEQLRAAGSDIDLLSALRSETPRS